MQAKALTYEFKDDPAAIVLSNVQTKDTVRVGVVDSVFGMTRLDDTLCNGEAIFLRFDYTDHLHITHQCGAEMRLRMQKTRGDDGKWLELKCWQCHSEYMPYRQIGDMDLSEPSRREEKETKAPIRLRTDVCGFGGLFYLAGYDRVVNAAQHPVSTIEDDRFGKLATKEGIVKIQVDRHRHIAFVHESCGRPMQVKITHTIDTYDKDFVWVKCRCKRFKAYNWLRKVVAMLPRDREWEIQRNKPAKEPTTPIDWMDAVMEREWDPESKTPTPRSLIINWMILALRDLRHDAHKEKSYGGHKVTWYHPSEPWCPWIHCDTLEDDQLWVTVQTKNTAETTRFDFQHKNDAAKFIRQVLTSSK